MAIDAQGLLDKHPIEDIVQRYITLKRDGAHLVGRCPFHDDQHASLKVTPKKQIAKCFACGWSGDAIAFVMDYTGKPFKEACHEIDAEAASEQGNAPKRLPKPKQAPAWERRDVPGEPYTGKFDHYRHGRPSRVWAYHLEDGTITGYVCRFDLPEGEKEVLPFVWATNKNSSEWRWMGFGSSRPLYNLHLLVANPNASVLIVEGEKTADAAQAQLDPAKTVVTTWPGGANAIAHVDWIQLYGRKVILWPDNDVQGLSAMLHVRHLIGHELKLSKIVPLDTTLPKGWDCADKEWKTNELREFVLSRMVDDIPANAKEPIKELGLPIEAWTFRQIGGEAFYTFGGYTLADDRWTFKQVEYTPQQPPPPEEPIQDEPEFEPPVEDEPIDYLNGNEHFRFLGFEKGEHGPLFHFFVNASKTVNSFSASGLTKPNLMTIAPLQWWEDEFPTKNGFDINAAQNYLINLSLKNGTFKERFVRGRGAWIDETRCIVHNGEHLIVNGQVMPLGKLDSRYVYERGDELGLMPPSHGLKTAQANRLIEVTKLINWEREINAYLLAGWCVVAPFCGALKWRPHIWLTGGAGTGKSWVFLEIVRPLLGDTGVAVQGETSEAGLRQMLGHDAMPVVFDEAEGEDKRAQERMQSVLSLMRAASADDGGLMIKGGASGVAKTYRIRSCFAFASIAPQLHQQSDRTRVTMLALRRVQNEKLRKERWTDLLKTYNEVITDDFVKGLQARTVGMMPTILKNAQTFANAAAAHLSVQRTGDQLGALLAGAYSLFSNGVISFEDALKWVADKDWTEERGLECTRDELLLLGHILEQLTNVEVDRTKHERSVGELVQIAHGDSFDVAGVVTQALSEDKLKRIGLKVEGDWLIISNSGDWIKRVLSGTPWARNHNKILMRLEGAEAVDSTRFASGIRTRAVRIPITVCNGSDDSSE